MMPREYRFARYVAVILMVGLMVGFLAMYSEAVNHEPEVDQQFQREAEESVKSLRECVRLAEKSITDLERAVRSRDRWKARALAAEGRAS